METCHVIAGGSHCGNRYLPKTSILSVRCFDSAEEHRLALDSSNIFDEANKDRYYDYLFYLKQRCVPEFECKCEIYTVWTEGQVERESPLSCTCNCSSLFPLYEIVVDISNCYPWPGLYLGEQANTRTLTFIVHPSEREHMERFLAGTDNPVSELVHYIKYDPIFREEVSKERQDAARSFKKLKEDGT
jgi:hypothetical protein